MIRPEPFAVAIPAIDLEDLRRRLEATRWADDFGNEDWAYGVERGWLEGMIGYWAGEFDWRAQEEAMNSLPQFRVELDGLLVHYVHARATTDDPIPLVLTHGWPWTFWDFKDMIVPLAEGGVRCCGAIDSGIRILAAPQDGSRYRWHSREMGRTDAERARVRTLCRSGERLGSIDQRRTRPRARAASPGRLPHDAYVARA